MSPRSDHGLHPADQPTLHPADQPTLHPAAPTRGTDDHWRRRASQVAHPSVASDSGSLLEAIAAGLAAVAVPWELDARRPQDPRQAAEPSNELLLSTEVYDAWIIHWPPGHSDDVHDHHGSAGAFAVVSGTLTEERWDAAGRVGVARVGAGESRAFADDTLHRLGNRREHTATTVHVYSPPLSVASASAADRLRDQSEAAGPRPPQDPPRHPKETS